MAYDVNEQVLLDAINNSALPDSAKDIIAALLNADDPNSPTSGVDLSTGEVAGPEVDLAVINESGIYDANGTPVIVVNSSAAVQLT